MSGFRRGSEGTDMCEENLLVSYRVGGIRLLWRVNRNRMALSVRDLEAMRSDFRTLVAPRVPNA